MYNFSGLKNKISEIQDWFKNEISSLRTGRATPALVENILIDSYGAKMPLKHVAAISIEDAKTLRVSPWDASLVKNIEDAIRASNVGIQPIVDKQTIRLILPELSEERRKSLLKILGDNLEDARISLRKERDEIWKDVQEKERSGEIPEDDKFRLKDKLQEIIDEAVKNLEEIAARKEQEIKS